MAGLIISAVALVITIVHHLKVKYVHHLNKPSAVLLHKSFLMFYFLIY